MKNIKLYPKVFIIFFVLFMLFGVVFIRGGEHYVIEKNYKDADFYSYVSRFIGYNKTKDSYFPISDDPQIILDFSKDYKEDIYGFNIKFSEEIDVSKVKIYYGRGENPFSEEDVEVFKKGKSDCITVFDADGFNSIRMDIDCKHLIVEFEVIEQIQYVSTLNKMDYVVLTAVSLVVSLLLATVEKINAWIGRGAKRIVYICKYLLKKKKNVLLYAECTVIMAGIAYLLEMLSSSIMGKDYFNKYRFVIFFTVMFIIVFSFWFRKYIGKYMHIYFFVVMMLVGSVNVYMTPKACGISWDDIIHYGRAAHMSWGGNNVISDIDFKNIERFSASAMDKSQYSITEREKWQEEFGDDEHKYVLYETHDYEMNLKSVAYIPSAIGMIMVRGLGGSSVDAFFVGKMMTLLAYAIILSASIKLLKNRGKLLILAIGFIPTSVFMATNYSYDWLVISGIILGYAMFYSNIQHNKPISTKKMALTMLVLIIAIIPKAIYFPLIFPMMLLGKEKYQNSKACRALVVAAMIILVGSFIMPMFIGSGSDGDMRGGSDVSVSGQISFILSNPMEYAGILTNFLMEYLSTDNAKDYLTMFAYFGKADFYTICLLLLAIVSIFDNGVKVDNKTDNPVVKTGAVLGVIGSIVLAATALYVDYTPVGLNTIKGCQPRYILPVLFVLMMCVFRIKLEVPDRLKNKLAMITCVAMSLVLLCGVYDLCIAFY